MAGFAVTMVSARWHSTRSAVAFELGNSNGNGILGMRSVAVGGDVAALALDAGEIPGGSAAHPGAT